jgi:hypothetical protein
MKKVLISIYAPEEDVKRIKILANHLNRSLSSMALTLMRIGLRNMEKDLIKLSKEVK